MGKRVFVDAAGCEVGVSATCHTLVTGAACQLCTLDGRKGCRWWPAQTGPVRGQPT